MRAIDVAGNVDASPASFVFTVDMTAANTTITSSPPAASNSTSASFSFTASDAGPGFECRLDSGAFADCSSSQSYSGLSETAHTFEVRAEDAAGNLDPTPATYAWTVDQTAPNTSLLSTPSNPSANTAPTFGLGSTETPSTFECNLDGGGWASCATPFTAPALGDGSRTFEVRATDAAGNTDRDPDDLHLARRRDPADRLDHRRPRTARTSAGTPSPSSELGRRALRRPDRALPGLACGAGTWTTAAERRAGTRPPRPTATMTSA